MGKGLSLLTDLALLVCVVLLITLLFSIHGLDRLLAASKVSTVLLPLVAIVGVLYVALNCVEYLAERKKKSEDNATGGNFGPPPAKKTYSLTDRIAKERSGPKLADLDVGQYR